MIEKPNKKSFLSPVVVFVFLVGLTISISLYIQISLDHEEVTHHEVEHLLKQEAYNIQKEIDQNLQVLESIKSFYNSSKHVDRDEFNEFLKTPLEKYQSIQAITWIPYIQKEQRVLYEKSASNELNKQFHIRSQYQDRMIISHVKDVYFPIYYIESLKDYGNIYGFDLASNNKSLKTIEEAVKQRKSLSVTNIELLQKHANNTGFFVYVPIWQKKDPKKIEGFVLGIYNASGIVNTALNREKFDTSLLDVWIVDEKNKNQLLYTNTSNKKFVQSEFYTQINVPNGVWTIYAKPSVVLNEMMYSPLPLIALFSTLFITLLITYITALKTAKEVELKKLVEEKTLNYKDANKKYQSLLDMFDKKVIASRTDLKGTITYATSAFAQISGYEKDELIGGSHNVLKHEDMPKRLYTNLWRTIQSGKVFTAEIKNKRKDGTFYWVRAVIMPEFDDNHNVVSYFAVRDDITAKKEVEELNSNLSQKVQYAVEENSKKDKLLLQQSKLAAMGEMIGAIAHQWRQPLNSLAIKIQFIEDDYEDELIDQEYLEKFSQESMKLVNFMSKTIDDFRNFFTIDKIKGHFDVKNKINETINMLKAQLENYDIELTLNGDNFEVLGYPSEFQQVILNIINNAKDELIEKQIEDALINIDIHQDEEHGYIKIQDNAGGIPKDVLERIFEPYFTTKEQGKGTGLGLYMSKMIIEDNMHGSLSANNTENGAQFAIKFALNQE